MKRRKSLIAAFGVLSILMLIIGIGVHQTWQSKATPKEVVETDDLREFKAKTPFRYAPSASSALPIDEEPETATNDDAPSEPPAVSVVAEAHFQASEDDMASPSELPVELQCPKRWVGVYSEDLDAQESAELATHSQRVAEEIYQNYNPNRPLAEVWPLFIEAEKQYRALALQEKRAGLSIGGGRIDSIYKQIHSFPEIYKPSTEDPVRFFDMYKVDMGDWSPDWNLYTLPDGREFRAKSGYRYRFHMTTSSAEQPNRLYGRTFEISHSQNAELIVIDNLEETSDATLEQIGGWNYNFNPYIGEE